MAMGIASMAAGFVGGQMQGWAALLDKWAMESAYRNEVGDQAGYRNQAMSAFNNRLGLAGSDAATKQMGTAYADRLGQYNAIDATPLGFTGKNQQSASAARDAASARMMGSQRANLMKYGDWLHNQQMYNMDTARQLDQITNFAGGNARVFPYLMYDAQHKYDSLAAAGAAIASMGGAMGGYKPPATAQPGPMYNFPQQLPNGGGQMLDAPSGFGYGGGLVVG